MKCPHFKKINFERIKEVYNEDTNVEDDIVNSEINHRACIEEDEASEYNVPEERIDAVQHLKNKMSTAKYSFETQIVAKEENIDRSDSELTFKSGTSSEIKMPRQMNIKRMMMKTNASLADFTISTVKTSFGHENQAPKGSNSFEVAGELIEPTGQSLLPDEDGTIPSEGEFPQTRKNPHVLVSKASLMTHQQFDIFSGLVFLSKPSVGRESESYNCELRNYIVKISRQNKLRYFFELNKVKVSLFKGICGSQLLLSASCTRKSQQISIYFMSAFQREIFEDVFLNSLNKLKEIKRKKKIAEQEKQNINRMLFNRQEEELSEIADEKEDIENSQTNDLMESSSASSLSFSSYDGDSMVFETQRLGFREVRDTANTFDIIMFKNKSLMSKVQRIFTNSDYDHTAMLLRTANNELLMLEATSNAGVAIYTFNSLLRIDRNKFFSRIAIRKYSGEKHMNKISRLQNFIRRTVGKKYKFDPMYLIKSQANQEKETFFCSELVAEALQEVGILSSQTPSFKYLPKNFASEYLNSDVIDGSYSETIILE